MGIHSVLPRHAETAQKGRPWSPSLVPGLHLVTHKPVQVLPTLPPSSESTARRISQNCASVNMQQGAVRSILLPNNTITRPEGTYRFRPCLLAYLILSGVAIVLASPNFLLDRSSTPALRIDLNHPPVGECSATPDQRVANQGWFPYTIT
jgi:hypothetical protein